MVGGNCLSKDLVYSARCKKCDLIYVGQTGEAIKTRFSKHRWDAKNRPKNCELGKHIHDNQDHNFDRDVEISIIKRGFKNPEDRKRAEDKLACQLGSVTPTGINEMQALGNYAKEMYDLHQNI